MGQTYPSMALTICVEVTSGPCRFPRFSRETVDAPGWKQPRATAGLASRPAAHGAQASRSHGVRCRAPGTLWWRSQVTWPREIHQKLALLVKKARHTERTTKERESQSDYIETLNCNECIKVLTVLLKVTLAYVKKGNTSTSHQRTRQVFSAGQRVIGSLAPGTPFHGTTTPLGGLLGIQRRSYVGDWGSARPPGSARWLRSGRPALEAGQRRVRRRAAAAAAARPGGGVRALRTDSGVVRGAGRTEGPNTDSDRLERAEAATSSVRTAGRSASGEGRAREADTTDGA